MKDNKWTNCYEESWQDVIVPEAFSHPAKMSYGLLLRILHHVKEQGWVKDLDLILDPFGGIGSTGILGAYEGYQVLCVELEAEFCREAASYECPGITKKEWARWYNRFRRNPDICPNCHQKAQTWYEKHSGIIPSREAHHFVGNFELHKNAWEKLHCPTPIMIQGDSRELSKIVSKADLVVSSPPFQESLDRGTVNAAERRELARKKGISNAEYVSPIDMERIGKRKQPNYGQTPGQLGSMKAGKVDMVLSSPPYAESLNSEKCGIDFSKAKKDYPGRVMHEKRIAMHKKRHDNKTYGSNPSNLGNLKSGDVKLVISSPPWEQSVGGGGNQLNQLSSIHYKAKKNEYLGTRKGGAKDFDYGQTNGQLGQEQGETFWSAAEDILIQCYMVLKPGGHAIFVVKAFVRKGKIVDFPGDWQRLCEAVGFKTVCIHHAMLVKETKQKTLFGHTEVKRKERKSFFRRLAESKGSPPINYEVVLCMSR